MGVGVGVGVGVLDEIKAITAPSWDWAWAWAELGNTSGANFSPMGCSRRDHILLGPDIFHQYQPVSASQPQ